MLVVAVVFKWSLWLLCLSGRCGCFVKVVVVAVVFKWSLWLLCLSGRCGGFVQVVVVAVMFRWSLCLMYLLCSLCLMGFIRLGRLKCVLWWGS